jgi:hypothetical protein
VDIFAVAVQITAILPQVFAISLYVTRIVSGLRPQAGPQTHYRKSQKIS